MYLQTFFPLIFTTCTYQIVNMQFGMYFTDVLTAKVPFYTHYEKSQSTFSHILHFLDCHVALLLAKTVEFVIVIFWLDQRIFPQQIKFLI